MGVTSSIPVYPVSNPVPSWNVVNTNAVNYQSDLRVAKWMKGGWIVAGLSGAVATSLDGTNWTAQSVASIDYRDAASSGSIWGLTGGTNVVYTANASNLASWTSRNPGITGTCYGLLYDGTRWIVVGGDSSTTSNAPRIRHSTDLVTWSNGYTSASVSTTFSAIAANPDFSYYVAVMISPQADYVTSTNGTSWSARTGIGASMTAATSVIWDAVGSRFLIAGYTGSTSNYSIVIRSLTTAGVLSTLWANNDLAFQNEPQPRLVSDGKNVYCFVQQGVYKLTQNYNGVFSSSGMGIYRNNNQPQDIWGADYANGKWIGANQAGMILFGDAPNYLG